MHLVYGQDALVADWVARRMPNFDADDSFGPCTAIGVSDGEKLIAGAVFHNYRVHDVEISFAADSPAWASPQRVKAIFSYPFLQLRCGRLTTVTGRKNKRARKLDEGLGFRLEGVARRAYDGQQDAVLYGMLREECKWIKGTGNG